MTPPPAVITIPPANIPATGNYVTASADGVAFTTLWSATGEHQVVVQKILVNNQNSIYIQGRNINDLSAPKGLDLYLVGISAVGTYTISPTGSSALQYAEGTVAYTTANNAGANATVTITKIDNTMVEGTFSFIGKKNNATETKTITSGSFRGVY